jgi:hypothetical protein
MFGIEPGTMHQITVSKVQGEQQDADPNCDDRSEGSRRSGHLPNQEAEKGPRGGWHSAWPGW